MRIANNLIAVNTTRTLGVNQVDTEKTIEKLSSGQRINKSADDAAGLSISEKMRAQIRGLNAASKNTQDAVSMLQTAEGALSEVHGIAQRIRVLAVQAANGTNTLSDRTALQGEVSQLSKEVDRIANTTEFNTKKLLNVEIDLDPDAQLKFNLIQGLKSGWLSEPASAIQNYFGLTASTRDMTVVLDPGAAGGDLASVQTAWSVVGPTATLTSMELHIDLTDAAPSTGPDGDNGIGFIPNDRIIAHEMVHAVMADSMGDAFYDLATWVKEGSAEFIAGGDERLKNDVAGSTLATVVSTGATLIGGGAWASNSLNYSASYLAMKYLDTKLTTDMASLMNDIKSGIGLEAAVVANTAYADLNAFSADFAANGAAYYGTLDIQGLGVDEVDVGAISGSDHHGGAQSSSAVVPLGAYSDNPTNFNVIFPSVDTGGIGNLFQVGANSGVFINFSFGDINSMASTLNLDSIDLVNDPTNAIGTADFAISKVSSNRAILGAITNRLENALKINNISSENVQAAESRIRDLDMAKEFVRYSKLQILSQAGQAMVSQANQNPQGILQLLR